MVKKTYAATISVDLDAPAQVVWRVLTDPDLIAQYMHGARTVTDWKVGSPIVWRGEWQGREYEDKGEVLAFEPNQRLATTHWSPLTGDADVPENYHHVTYELTQIDAGRTRLTLTHGNSPDQASAEAMIENGWKPTLTSVKELAEELQKNH
jgi:uncharacterized protein YndB with AHSA1/START domain